MSTDTVRTMQELSGAERVLVYLRDAGPVEDTSGLATPTIAEACRIRGTSCSALLAELEARGLIARDVSGRRTRRVELTADGKAAARKIEAAYEQLEVAEYPDLQRDRRIVPPMPDLAKRTSLEGPSSNGRPPRPPRPPEPSPPAERERPTDALETLDPELFAIARCVRILESVESQDERVRVVGYLVARFGTNVEFEG